MTGSSARRLALPIVLLGLLTLACALVPREDTSPSEHAKIDEVAALKLARDHGMKEGLAAWTVELGDHPQYGLAWSVRNILVDGRAERRGQVFLIDARSGALLDTMGWMSQWVIDDPGPVRITPVDSAEPPN